MFKSVIGSSFNGKLLSYFNSLVFMVLDVSGLLNPLIMTSIWTIDDFQCRFLLFFYSIALALIQEGMVSRT